MKAVSFFVCLLVLALVGCKGGGEANAVGKWKGEIKMPETAKDDPMAKMAEGLMAMLAFNLELKADHKYTMTVMVVNLEGDWSMSGNTITLTPKTIMGLTPDEYKKKMEKENANNPMAKSAGNPDDAAKPMTLEMQPDGKSMKAILPGEEAAKTGGGDLIFTKQAS